MKFLIFFYELKIYFLLNSLSISKFVKLCWQTRFIYFHYYKILSSFPWLLNITLSNYSRWKVDRIFIKRLSNFHDILNSYFLFLKLNFGFFRNSLCILQVLKLWRKMIFNYFYYFKNVISFPKDLKITLKILDTKLIKILSTFRQYFINVLLNLNFFFNLKFTFL